MNNQTVIWTPLRLPELKALLVAVNAQLEPKRAWRLPPSLRTSLNGVQERLSALLEAAKPLLASKPSQPPDPDSTEPYLGPVNLDWPATPDTKTQETL
jgi:hypothetical protein